MRSFFVLVSFPVVAITFYFAFPIYLSHSVRSGSSLHAAPSLITIEIYTSKNLLQTWFFFRIVVVYCSPFVVLSRSRSAVLPLSHGSFSVSSRIYFVTVIRASTKERNRPSERKQITMGATERRSSGTRSRVRNNLQAKLWRAKPKQKQKQYQNWK